MTLTVLELSLKSAFATSNCEAEMVVGEGFEPSKSMTADLQSAPFGRSGTPPLALLFFVKAGRIIPNVGTL